MCENVIVDKVLTKRLLSAVFSVIVVLVIISIPHANSPDLQPPDRLMLVAHAGGMIDGFAGTNSLEALYSSAAAGYQYIEVDMLVASGGGIVLAHDWEYMTGRVPGAPNMPVTRDAFMQYSIFHRYSPVDLDMLIAFLDEHRDIRIITDTKDNGYSALSTIASRFPRYVNRFIPQAYAFEDVPYIKALGFDDVIVTLYEMPRELQFDPGKIALLVEEWRDEIFGVTIYDGLLNEQYLEYLDLSATRFFAHTIDSPGRAEVLQSFGFCGIYTGHLLYDDAGRLAPVLAPQVDAQLLQIRQRLEALDDAEDIPDMALMYRLQSPVYIAHGQAMAINDAMITNIFTRFRTGELYIPVAHFADSMVGYQWSRWEHDSTSLSLTIETSPGEHVYLETNGTDGPLIHRSIPFIGKSTIERIFPYRVVQLDSYVFVLPDDANRNAHELLAIAQYLFGG